MVNRSLPDQDIPNRVIPDPQDTWGDYWVRVKEISETTMDNAKKVFDLSYYVNIIVIVFGILLFAISIYNISIKGVEWENTVLGGIGVAAVLSNFFYSPQTKIQKALGDFVQVQMVLRSYHLMLVFITDWERIHEKEMDIDKVGEIVDLLVKNTTSLSSHLEIELGKEPEKPTPADIKTSDLQIKPPEVNSGEKMTVTIIAKNFGQKSGSAVVEVYVDGSMSDTKEVKLDGGESKTVTFEVTSNIIGTHTVQVDDLTGEFTVAKSPKPDDQK